MFIATKSSGTLGGALGRFGGTLGRLEGVERPPDELKAGKPTPNLREPPGNLAEPPLKVDESTLKLLPILGYLSVLNHQNWRSNAVLSIKLSNVARSEKISKNVLSLAKSFGNKDLRQNIMRVTRIIGAYPDVWPRPRPLVQIASNRSFPNRQTSVT